MIPSEVADRIATVILGSSRCRGFALVMFYDDGETDTLVAEADPKSAAELLTQIADDYYRETANCWRSLAG